MKSVLWNVFGAIALLEIASITVDAFRDQELFQREVGAFALVTGGIGRYIFIGLCVFGTVYLLEFLWSKFKQRVPAHPEQSDSSLAAASIETLPVASRRKIGYFNPFRCTSEGVRRISILLSGIALILWAGFVWNFSDGLNPLGWVVFLLAPIGAYLLIMLIRAVLIWVAVGFREPPT